MRIRTDFACIPEPCRDQHLTMVPEYAKAFRHHDIRGVGIHEVVAPYEIRRAGAPWHLILFTCNGAARYECNGRRGEIHTDELWVGPANVSYRYQAIGEWKMVSAALFPVEGLVHLEGQVTHKSVAHPLQHLVAAVEAYLSESAHTTRGSEPALSALAEYISLTIRREVSPASPSETGRAGLQLRKLWEAVNATPAGPWAVSVMAERLFVSVRQFQRMMKAHYNMTAEEMLKRLRMEHARELLLATSLPIAMIADKVGYQSVYSFSKAFKKYFQASPGAFRKKAGG